MPTLLQFVHSAPSDICILGTAIPALHNTTPTPNSAMPAPSDGYILTSSNLYIPLTLRPRRTTARSPDDILSDPWPEVRKAVRAELTTAPTNALLRRSSTISQFFNTSRRNAPLLYTLHHELLASVPSLSDLPAELSPSTLQFILRHLSLFDDFLPDHLHYLPVSALISLIIYLSVPTFTSGSRLTAPQDEPVLFLARRHLINISPDELETFASLPENPALYIIRRLAKRHLPRDKVFLQCLDDLASIRHRSR